MRGYEDVKMLQDAEEIADAVWFLVSKWDYFAKDTVARQLVRATDSIGANIAESFGRFHYGEKVNFLYYARGSTFECKYWLNRAVKRNLITQEQHQVYAETLTSIAKQVNGFAGSLTSRRSRHKSSTTLRESEPVYLSENDATDEDIYSELQLDWLQTSIDSDKTTLNAIRTDPRYAPTP